MRKFPTILILLLCLVGTGFVTSVAWANGPTSEAKKSENSTDKKADKKSDKKDSHAMTTSPTYLGIDPIYTTILEQDIVVGTMMLGIGLDVPDPQLRDEISRNMPMLRDLYVRTMLSYTAINIRSWRQPNVEDIATRLQAATDKKFKKRGARVLLAQVAIRMNN